MQHTLTPTAASLDAKLEELLKEFDRVDSSNIRSFAARFCQFFGLTEIPRDPFVIFSEVFGIELRHAIMPRSCPAQWGLNGDRYEIEYSEHRDSETLSLTLWHELFEIISAHPAFPTRLTSDIECKIATMFAINVTMPEKAIRIIAEKYGHPELQDKTFSLAYRFSSS